jgi:hypothetical protein
MKITGLEVIAFEAFVDRHWFGHFETDHRVDSYVRLTDELSIRVCSPEIAEGGIFTRAEWIRRRGSDMSRILKNHI